jgi:cytoskeleton-associated protein 5
VNDELKLKVLKWNFAIPRDEFVDQLKEQMNTAGVNKSLMTNMFHADFKFHLKAIDALAEVINFLSSSIVQPFTLFILFAFRI